MVNTEFEEYLNETEIRKRLNWYSKNYGPYIEKRGLNNWKNLFKKPNLLEWTILFMLLMGLFMGWAYHNDISTCQEFVKAVNENPCYYCTLQTNRMLNLSANLVFKEVNLTKDLMTGEIG